MQAGRVIFMNKTLVNKNNRLTNKYNFISIIIVNKNDKGIVDTLSGLVNISSPLKYEVIVVDASRGKLDDIKKRFKVRWFAFEPVKNKRTIAEQRNLGVKKAKGEIIVFIDANCLPSKNWLSELVSPILNEDEKIVAGSVTSRGRKSIYDNPLESIIGKKYLTECPAINSAFSREVFETVGEFDEKLGYGEDADFTWRAVDAGYKIRYIPKANIAHEWGAHKDEIKRAFRYGVGRTRLYKKHKNRWKDLFAKDTTLVTYSSYIIGLPITIVFWPYPLLIFVPLIKNVNNYPIKTIEDHLIFGAGVIWELIRI